MNALWNVSGDRPISRFWLSVLGSGLAWLSMQAPLAAQSSLPQIQTAQQTSLRTLHNSSVGASNPVSLPFRVRGPYMPTANLAPAFPEAMLPEAVFDIHLVIRLGERRVYLYRGDKVETSYPIAVGRQGWETPTGRYEVLNMIEHPEWQHPFTGEVVPAGPSNPLGERWIGFWTDGTNYIGFHGTPNESSVGRAASHGCIRMYNRDVRALFEVVALGTPVIVEP